MDSSPTRVMVIFTLLGAGAIGGFGVHRLLSAEYGIASFDFFVALSFLSLGYYTHKTGKDGLARFLSAAIAAVGPLVFIRAFDDSGLYWVYSSTIIIYYLVPYRWAMGFNAVMLLSMSSIFWDTIDHGGQFYSFLVTIGLINGFSLMFALDEERSRMKLKALSIRDDLTNIGNRRAFSARILEIINKNKRYGLNACLVCIDIDKFKDINDSLGHGAGDTAIKKLSSFITGMLRESDEVFRIGGDEFVIIAEGADQDSGTQLTEKIRQAVEEEEFIPDRPLTISLGASVLKDTDTPESWLSRADEQLYKAKSSGRNQVYFDGEIIPVNG